MVPDQSELKKIVAREAVNYVKKFVGEDFVLGVGTGSTVNCFIDALKSSDIKGKIKATVASSVLTENRLINSGFKVQDLNDTPALSLYVDGADEVNTNLEMIKGGGGALTREKIVAATCDKFICIADRTKYVKVLGTFPLPLEVIEMAKNYVSKQMIKLGGTPVFRENFVTDNGNIILDIHNLKISNPRELEEKLNNITGAVTNGLFAKRKADVLILSGGDTKIIEM